MLARKLAPALAVGCSIIAKPAAQTPLSALALAVLSERAGIPRGIFNVVTSSDAEMVGQSFCANELVAKISFTGSTNVGRILMRQGADQIKKLSLELGGNAPFIVFDDADIDAAVEGLLRLNSGTQGKPAFVQTASMSNQASMMSLRPSSRNALTPLRSGMALTLA